LEVTIIYVLLLESICLWHLLYEDKVNFMSLREIFDDGGSAMCLRRFWTVDGIAFMRGSRTITV